MVDPDVPIDRDRKIRQTFRLGEYEKLSLPPLPLRPPMRLTPGEREVIALMFQGKSDAQIAKARGTSVRTVLNQVTSIFRKLGIKSRDELMALLGAAK
ncbi:MAG: helix-turn-helix transcriptional regulator [Archangiaceae bacterium]|nr:helix-turn-helix transcriptional regulator [Archangiaceae bacterium]